MTRKEFGLRECAVKTAFYENDLEQAVSMVMRLIDRSPSKKFYRFRPPKMHEINALENNEIYLCRPAVYEDEGDCEILYDIAELCRYFMLEMKPKKYERLYDYVNNKLMDEIVSRMENEPRFKKMRDEIRNECLVACITQNNTKYMWENYAQNGEGICLEYDMADVLLGHDSMLKIFPVRYVEDRNKTEDIFFTSKELNDTDEAFDNARRKYLLSCMTKNRIPFSQEREWRLLCEYQELNDGENGKLYDFVPPTKIVLGKNISKHPEFMEKVLEYALNKKIDVEQYKVCE